MRTYGYWTGAKCCKLPAKISIKHCSGFGHLAPELWRFWWAALHKRSARPEGGRGVGGGVGWGSRGWGGVWGER